MIERTREEARLPDVPTGSSGDIEVFGEIGMRPAQSGGERLRVLRHADQVDVVGHEAVSPQRQPGALGVVLQEIFIKGVVFRATEDLLAAVAALGHVVRKAFGDEPGDSRHRRISGGTGRFVSEKMCLRILSRDLRILSRDLSRDSGIRDLSRDLAAHVLEFSDGLP